MSLDRIADVISLQPVRAPAGRPQEAGPWLPGETIELRFDAIAASIDAILATTVDGRQMRLSGLGGLAQGLTPGALLSLRVLATTPRLELALLAALAPPDAVEAQGGDVEQSAAMRFDQISMTRQVLAKPDASSIARAWRGTALMQAQQGALGGVLFEAQASARIARGNGSGAAGSGLAGTATLGTAALGSAALGTAALSKAGLSTAGLSTAAPGAAPNPRQAETAPGAERWPFAPSNFGLRRASWAALETLDAQSDPSPWKKAGKRRRRPALALTLEASLPGLGAIFLRLQLVAGRVLLDIHCEEQAVGFVRQCVPELIVAIGCAGLRVARCRLLRSADRPAPGAASGMPELRDAASGFASPLFRAAAELSMTLSSPTLAERLNRWSR